MSEGKLNGEIFQGKERMPEIYKSNHLLLVDQIAMCFRKQFVVLNEIKTEITQYLRYSDADI